MVFPTENSTTGTMISGPVNGLGTTTVIIAAVLSPLAPLIITVYVLGFLSGWCCLKFKHSRSQHSSINGETNQTYTSGEITPIYEEARQLSAEKSPVGTEQHQSLDMTENVAYGPLKTITHMNVHTDNL